MRTLSRVLSAFFILAVLSACAAPRTFYKSDSLGRDDQDSTVVLMPTDIELSELLASGLTQVNAEWSKAATEHSQTALQQTLAEKQTVLIPYNRTAEDDDRLSRRAQMVKVTSAMGNSMILHQFNPQFALPTKKDTFDWSVGPEIQDLGRELGADYGLFVTVRDSYTTPGRAALMVVGAILGVGIQGGQQLGIATLVDFKSGDVVWTNFLFRGTGDMRTLAGASETIEALLDEFPSR